jgi:hypothetical protein
LTSTPLVEVDVLAGFSLGLVAAGDGDRERHSQHNQHSADEHRNGFRTKGVDPGPVVAELQGVDQDHDAEQCQEYADPVLGDVPGSGRPGRRGVPCGRGCLAHASPNLVRTFSTAVVCSARNGVNSTQPSPCAQGSS